MERKVEQVREEVVGRAAAGEGCGLLEESEARRVFGLMKRLEGGAKQRKAPLGTVFRLTVGLSQRATARRCGCVAPLISRRVRTIEARLGMSVERLRNYASTILEMETAVKRERFRKKKRGAPSDEPAQYEMVRGGRGWWSMSMGIYRRRGRVMAGD